MICTHLLEEGKGSLLRLRMHTPEANETFWAVIACWQRTEMSAHVTQSATSLQSAPFLRSRRLQNFWTMNGLIDATNVASVFLYKRTRIELRVNHHGVEPLVAQQRSQDVWRGTVVEVLGGKHAPAIMWSDVEPASVMSASSRLAR
ncbi:hypothetical protein ASF14_19210 [Sphingomonas sp. Leaf257]|nr:hypothetical protein ASF14_19210 [Sphingomonas sp. Leaf257]